MSDDFSSFWDFMFEMPANVIGKTIYGAKVADVFFQVNPQKTTLGLDNGLKVIYKDGSITLELP